MDGEVELFAMDIQNGKRLWAKKINTGYTGGTLTVKSRRLAYHSDSGLTLFDSSMGKEIWTETVMMAMDIEKGKPLWQSDWTRSPER